MSAVLERPAPGRPRLARMQPEDLDAVVAIESAIYSHPWTRGNFIDSLRAEYECWVWRQDGALIGYFVLAVAAGEAHLLNFSIAGNLQRRGYGGALLERVVAVVDGRPLLLSELRAMERVRGLSEPAALEALVDERLMYLEASRLPQAEVLPDEEQRAAAELLERRPELSEAVPAPDLRRLVSQQVAILKYVEFRFRPQLRVSDQEVRSAFEADPSAGDSWEAAKERVRARLERRALDERVEAWVRELRGRADVRYVERPAPPAAP